MNCFQHLIIENRPDRIDLRHFYDFRVKLTLHN